MRVKAPGNGSMRLTVCLPQGAVPPPRCRVPSTAPCLAFPACSGRGLLRQSAQPEQGQGPSGCSESCRGGQRGERLACRRHGRRGRGPAAAVHHFRRGLLASGRGDRGGAHLRPGHCVRRGAGSAAGVLEGGCMGPAVALVHPDEWQSACCAVVLPALLVSRPTPCLVCLPGTQT